MVWRSAWCASSEPQAWLTSGCHMRGLQSLVRLTLKGFRLVSTVALSRPTGTEERGEMPLVKNDANLMAQCSPTDSVASDPVRLFCIFFSFSCSRFWEIADLGMFREVVVVI